MFADESRRLVLILALLALPTGAGAQELDRALAIEREVVRIASEGELWPGFAPLAIPLAIFTGGRTWLFRHPAPPDGFSPVPGAPGVHAHENRHPRVTSNTSAEIGGVVTATLLADGARATRSATTLAAVALHEAFHVHQRARHPGWIANEGDAFLYPVADPALLELRRLESAALRRAVRAADSATAACWARQALDARDRRFAAMDSAFVAYERLNELNEGLASYVQMRAGGVVDSIPEGGFAADAVRARVYATGPALGQLLDRLDPGWAGRLARNGGPSPDEVLAQAVGRASTTACAWPGDERDRIATQAQADVAALRASRTERRRAFDGQGGWRIVIRAAAGLPLFPQGFDPLNVQPIDGGLLHTRFLELGNGDDRVRVIDEGGADLTTLTVGAGAHPLFNGVREAIVAGLERPRVERDGTRLVLDATGFAATFADAELEESGQTIVITLAPSRRARENRE
ncbi:MAG TPA: hypothetical protein VK922_16415 [Gemmatimonadaceae bacterium]|nr:hypothetical protein [Gemmatimonadaceae bacterium]